MRTHVLTINKVENGYIIEATGVVNHPDWAKGTLDRITLIAKTPEEVMAFINKHLETEQLSLPL